MSVRGPDWQAVRKAERVEQRIVIEADGTVVARSGKVEYGQGIRTGFARIVAEELRVPIRSVRVELGETDRVPWDLGTFGSMSTATDGKALRAAAAFARTLLLGRASTQLGVAPSALHLHAGRVVAPDGRALGYAELTALEPLTGSVPGEGSTTDAERAEPVEAAPMRLEALAIVTGAARYPADVRLPGMLRGHVLHPPSPGAKLVSLDDRAARAIAGVVAVVREGDVVGVVAQRDEQALAGVYALEAQWKRTDTAPAQNFDAVLRRDPGVDAALARATLGLRSRYRVPHIAHASICPSAAVADVREHGADLYVATQRPFAVRDEAAELLGLPPERVCVHPQMTSGLYGRGNVADASIDAVRLSRAVKRPVLVQWTRAEEFRLAPQRPKLDAVAQAALDPTGAIVAWRYSALTNPHTYGAGPVSARLVEITSGRNAVPPYRLGKAEITLQVVPGAIRTGAFRSLAAAPHVFAIESFIDELAHVSRQDPIAFRLRSVDDARLRRVLETVRARSNWERRLREPGRGFGVACALYNGTYVAEVAEVTVAPIGRVSVDRVWCAVDAGRLVHPDGARNQIEGGVQQAASWSLLEELRHHAGEVITASWRDYPIGTCNDAPREIDVVFASDADTPSTGIGEPGSVPTAAAIANAVFDACGVRARELPLTAEALLGAGR